MNGLPLNIKEILRRKSNYYIPLTEEDVRLLIMHHNSRGYKGKFISEGQIPILSLRKILDGCEDYYITQSNGRWNLIVRTLGGIILYEPIHQTPPAYAVQLAEKVAKAYSMNLKTVVPHNYVYDHENGYLCIDFLESQIENLVSRF